MLAEHMTQPLDPHASAASVTSSVELVERLQTRIADYLPDVQNCVGYEPATGYHSEFNPNPRKCGNCGFYKDTHDEIALLREAAQSLASLQAENARLRAELWKMTIQAREWQARCEVWRETAPPQEATP